MTFVFWQNIISMHQSEFLIALYKRHDVILVVEQEIMLERKETGWKVPELEGIKVIIAPNKELIKNLINENVTAWHLFSGLHAYKLPRMALKICKNLNVNNLAVITESYQTTGLLGRLRRLKYLWLSKLYKNKLEAIFVTGRPARECFENLYFDKSILFDWGYFTKDTYVLNVQNEPADLPNLLFVGSVDHNKNLIPIIALVLKHKSLFHRFYIAGKGPLVPKLKDVISKQNSVEYLGVLKNEAIKRQMQHCDLLILPSLYDGWGAVINEALSQGMRVLCSNQCGASVLLDGKTRGSVYDHKNGGFELHLTHWLKKGKVNEKERIEIMEWAQNHISGEAAANYFIECISFLNKEIPNKPQAPWLL